MRTLRDYKNFIRPKVGFRRQVLDNLIDQTKDYFDVQRYVCLMFDEMKIKSNLVFNKHTEELIGFTDLGDPDINYNEFDESTNKLATHTLAFYLRGISTTLKFCLANFATDNISSSQLVPIFWDAVSYLEKTCNLWVVAVTSDGASSNRSFYKIICGNKTSIPYKVKNLEAPWRYIYLFCDAPHLLKTLRNALYSSGTNLTRYLWNDGYHLLWEHISKMYYEDQERGLKLLPKITHDHIHLNSYSKMTVKFAAQVLSKTMAAVLKQYGGKEVKETAKFCDLIDSFFDCLNVRSPRNIDDRKRKPFLRPYCSVEDERFTWITSVFLPYFKDWKSKVENRPDQGELTKTERDKMFIPRQSYEGIVISANSLIECVKFLLNEGMEYVLTERFCQDPVEEYFGNQRKLGRRSDNPDFNQYLYNDNTIRIQREVSVSSGNTRGKYDRKRAWENVTDEKLPKLKRK